jgi:hypothetical protein
LNLSSDFLVSKFGFKFDLYRYAEVAQTLAGLGVGKFTVRALGWADQPEHYPLSYEFYKKTGTGAGAVFHPLSSTQSSNVLEVLLPEVGGGVQCSVIKCS